MKKLIKLSIFSVFVLSIIAALNAFIPSDAVQAGSGDWPQFQKDAANSGITSEEGPVSNISVGWKQNVSSDGHAGVCVEPLVAEGNVFVYDAFSVMWAFDAKTGAEVWNTELSFEGQAFQLATPAYYGGKLYVASNDGHVYALNAQNGSIIWSTQVCDILEQLNTPVTYSGGKIYVGRWSQDNPNRSPSYYCLDAASGTIVWERASTSGGGYYWAGGCVIGNYFVYGDGKDYLVAVDKNTGNTADELCVADLPYAPSSSTESRMIRGAITWKSAGSGYGNLYFTDFLGEFANPLGGFLWKVGFDSSTGQFNREAGSGWSVNIGYSTSTPVIYNGRIYVGSGNFGVPGKLHCFNEQGSEIWSFAAVGGVESSPMLTSNRGNVYIYFNANCVSGTTYCLDQNGTEIWRFINDEQGTTGGYVLQGIAVSDGWLYFGNDGGAVYGITSSGSSAPADTTAPTIANISPASGGTIENVQPIIGANYFESGTGIDIARIQMVVDNVDVTSSAITTATGISYTPTVSLQDGVHSVQLTVYDNAGNKAYRSWSFIVVAPLDVDNTPPTITNLSPPPGVIVGTDTPVISAAFFDTDSGISSTGLALLVDGINVTSQAIVTGTGISYTPNTPLPNGTRSVQLYVYDQARNQAYRTWSFRVEVTASSDTTPPTVSEVVPTPEAILDTATPTISAEYSDAKSNIDTTSVILKVDGSTVDAVITTTNVSYTPTITLTSGEHSIELRVSDTEGNQVIYSWTFRVKASTSEMFDWITDTSGRNPEKIEVASVDALVELNIPEGTLATFEQNPPPGIRIQQSDQSPAVSDDFQAIGKVYEISPDGTSFDSPATLVISYTEIFLPSLGMVWDTNADGNIDYLDITLIGGAASNSIKEEYFKIGRYDETVNDWVILENSVVDTEKNTVTGKVDHFSKYTILSSVSESLPATFTIESIVIDPETAAPDENINITVLIANTGEFTGNYDMPLNINGVTEAVEGMILAPGEERSVVFTTSKNVIGTYSVEVGGQTASFTIAQTPGNVAESNNGIATTTPFRERDAITADMNSTNWLLSGGIAGAIVIAGAIAIIILLRRRRDVKN